MGIATDIVVGGRPMDSEAESQAGDGLVLDVRDLHVSYAGAVQALRGVSLQMTDGAVVAVLGNNGAARARCCARSPERCTRSAERSPAARSTSPAAASSAWIRPRWHGAGSFRCPRAVASSAI